MPPSEDETPGPLAAFLRTFHQDVAAKTPRTLAEYLVQFPGAEAEITSHFAAWQDSTQRLRTGEEWSDFEILDDDAPPALPTIPGYRIDHEIGRGAQGVVYLATQESLGREIALKILTGWATADPKRLRRFQQEALALSKFEDPGICTVYDSAVADRVPYIAMQLVKGETLAERIRATRDSDALDRSPVVGLSGAAEGSQQTLSRLVAFIESAARSLHHAHKIGLIHRDLKPANIMVTPEGLPVILDFGLARELSHDGKPRTETGLAGTLPYMSPEQVGGDVDLDARTDVWSLGVTLYECLTGTRPFDRPSEFEILRAIREETPVPPRELNREVPRDLSIVLEAALEKNRARRYASAAAFADDLRRFSRHELIHARRAGALYKTWRWTQRNPWIATLLFVVTVVAIGLAFLLVERDTTIGQKEAALRLANGRQLLAQASDQAQRDPALAILLALECHNAEVESDATKTIVDSLSELREYRTLQFEKLVDTQRPPIVVRAHATDDRTRVFTTSSKEGEVASSYEYRVWDVASGGTVWKKSGSDGDMSPDGAWVALASGTNAILCSVGTGAEYTVYAGRAPVGSVRFGPTDRSLLVASADGLFRIEAPPGGGPPPTRGEAPRVISTPLRFAVTSSDGQRILTILENGKVEFRDSAGQLVSSYPDGNYWSGTFSNDGRHAIVRALGVARVLDVASGRASTPEGVTFERAGFSPDGGSFITCGHDADRGSVHIYDARTGKGSSLPSSLSVVAAGLGPGDRFAAAALVDGTIKIWDLHSGQVVSTLRRHYGDVRDLEFTKDGLQLVTASEDGTARIWHGPPESGLSAIDGGVGTEIFSDDDSRVVKITEDRGSALVLDTATRKTIAHLSPQRGAPIVSAAISPDGRAVVTVGGGVTEGHTVLWGSLLASPTETELAWNGGRPDRARFSSDGARVVAWRRGVMAIWDSVTKQPVEFDVQGAPAGRAPSFSPDGRWALLGSGSRLVDLRNRTSHIFRLKEGFPQLATFSADGSAVALDIDERNTIEVWKTESVTNEATITARGMGQVSFDARRVLAWGANGIDLWTWGAGKARRIVPFMGAKKARFIEGGKEVVLLYPDEARIARSDTGEIVKIIGLARDTDVEVSSTASRLIAMPTSGPSIVWDTRSWKEIARFSELGVCDLSLFSPRGSWYLACSRGGMRFLPMDPRSMAMRLSPRKLTDEERVEFSIRR